VNEHADSAATQSERDTRYMRRALELAARGLYTTDPNPRVGCVLVRDGTSAPGKRTPKYTRWPRPARPARPRAAPPPM
jgi:hypothetical protein